MDINITQTVDETIYVNIVEGEPAPLTIEEEDMVKKIKITIQQDLNKGDYSCPQINGWARRRGITPFEADCTAKNKILYNHKMDHIMRSVESTYHTKRLNNAFERFQEEVIEFMPDKRVDIMKIAGEMRYSFDRDEVQEKADEILDIMDGFDHNTCVADYDGEFTVFKETKLAMLQWRAENGDIDFLFNKNEDDAKLAVGYRFIQFEKALKRECSNNPKFDKIIGNAHLMKDSLNKEEVNKIADETCELMGVERCYVRAENDHEATFFHFTESKLRQIENLNENGKKRSSTGSSSQPRKKQKTNTRSKSKKKEKLIKFVILDAADRALQKRANVEAKTERYVKDKHVEVCIYDPLKRNASLGKKEKMIMQDPRFYDIVVGDIQCFSMRPMYAKHEFDKIRVDIPFDGDTHTIDVKSMRDQAMECANEYAKCCICLNPIEADNVASFVCCKPNTTEHYQSRTQSCAKCAKEYMDNHYKMLSDPQRRRIYAVDSKDTAYFPKDPLTREPIIGTITFYPVPPMTEDEAKKLRPEFFTYWTNSEKKYTCLEECWRACSPFIIGEVSSFGRIEKIFNPTHALPYTEYLERDIIDMTFMDLSGRHLKDEFQYSDSDHVEKRLKEYEKKAIEDDIKKQNETFKVVEKMIPYVDAMRQYKCLERLAYEHPTLNGVVKSIREGFNNVLAKHCTIDLVDDETDNPVYEPTMPAYSPDNPVYEPTVYLPTIPNHVGMMMMDDVDV